MVSQGNPDDAQGPAYGDGHARRSAATRGKLIRATISTLDALGFAATTTIEVARRAGVSRGAMLHHFSTRAGLLLATAEFILREQECERRDVQHTKERGKSQSCPITVASWEMMQRPEAVALTEIMLGGRSDPEIHASFSTLIRSFNRCLLDGPIQVDRDFGQSNNRLVRAMARLHVAAMRGLVIDKLYCDASDTSIDDAFQLLVWYKGLAMRRLENPEFASAAEAAESLSLK